MLRPHRRSTLTALIAGLVMKALAAGTAAADHVHGGMPGLDPANEPEQSACGVELEKSLTSTEPSVFAYPFN